MLEYFALIMLCLSVTAIFYLFIYIHDLPYNIAKKRNHPQKEAIHYACWLSLFTLHAIWPLVFLWSVIRQGPMTATLDGESSQIENELTNLKRRLLELEKQLQVNDNKVNGGETSNA